jgi:hypothetical protein
MWFPLEAAAGAAEGLKEGFPGLMVPGVEEVSYFLFAIDDVLFHSTWIQDEAVCNLELEGYVALSK